MLFIFFRQFFYPDLSVFPLRNISQQPKRHGKGALLAMPEYVMAQRQQCLLSQRTENARCLPSLRWRLGGWQLQYE